MTKRFRSMWFLVSIVAIVVVLTTMTAGVVAAAIRDGAPADTGVVSSAGRPDAQASSGADNIREFMDAETTRLFDDMSPEAQDLMLQIWARIEATAPESAKAHVVAKYVRSTHKYDKERE